MSFHDIVQNHPFVLKGVLLDVWQELPGALREKLTFHTFVYNSTDVGKIHSHPNLPRACRLCWKGSADIVHLCDFWESATASSI